MEDLLDLWSSASDRGSLQTRFCSGRLDSQLTRVLVVPRVFYSRRVETTVLLGTFRAAGTLLESSPDLCLDPVQPLSSGGSSVS